MRSSPSAWLRYGAFCFPKSFQTRSLLARWNVHVLANITAKHLLAVGLSVGCLIILVGTLVFHSVEDWSLFDAYYYCVITLGTIGLGDFVPLQTNGRLQANPGYVLFTLFFILFGLAIFSACVNLLVLEFMAHNADVVTARSRLRQLLALRRNSVVMLRNAKLMGNSRYALRLCHHYDRHSLSAESKTIARSVSSKTIRYCF